MALYQRRHVQTRDSTVFNHPAPADHYAVGMVCAAQHQRGQRITGTGETQLVQPEQCQIGLRARWRRAPAISFTCRRISISCLAAIATRSA